MSQCSGSDGMLELELITESVNRAVILMCTTVRTLLLTLTSLTSLRRRLPEDSGGAACELRPVCVPGGAAAV